MEKCKEQQETVLGKIKSPFNGSIQQLEREIKEFKETQNEKKNILREYQDDLDKIRMQEKRIASQLSEMDRKHNTFICQREQEQEYHSERAKFITSLCAALEIELKIDLENTTDSVDDILLEIRGGLRRQEATIKSMSNTHEKLDHDMQLAIDRVREKETTIKSDVTSMRKQVADLKSEKCKTQQKITEIEKYAESLKAVNAKLEKVNSCYEKYTQTINLDESKKLIADKRLKYKQLQEQLDKIDEELTFLNSISKLTAEI